ncbi:hypothetical protein [Limnohabitans sp.]|uniref:hypothetical protein n=1 Tax=Limnohabitans sp. TaxID=1907725 RepID=UPI00286F8704|nr:hypothetical protein [Limnohabitans sp.]
MKKISIGLLFGFLSFMAWSQSSTYLWPTILFVKGQDLCQFEESYGTTRIEQVNEMTGQLKDLMRYGATTSEGVSALLNLDAMTDRQRAQATAGNRMDVTLEASLKAYLDRMYLGFSPSDVKLKFFNPGPLGELIKNLREHQRQDKLDVQQLSVLSGIAWGTYAYGPGCKGDVLVTIHIELVNGTGVSFQAQGKPETVMSAIAADMVRYFQRTSFPSVVMMGDKSLILVGTAGSPVNTAPNPVIAERSCALIKARLPTLEEYEFLSVKGDWNNGISLDHKLWAMSGNRVLNPDTRNPTPVRTPADTNYEAVSFYCVR